MIGLNVMGRISSIYNELSKSEKKIGDFLLENPKEVTRMTALEVANASNVSPATVIRFCKSIGIPSFTQLKVTIASELERPTNQEYSDIEENESVEKIKEKLLANAHQTMFDTAQYLEDKKIEESVTKLQEAPLVFTFGVGASWLVAENISQKFNRIGKSVIAISDLHILLATIVSAPKKSVLIAISNSGNTKEVNSLVDLANKYGLVTIGLSQFGNNQLSQKVDVSLQTVKANEAEMRSAATSSLHAQFIAIDILFYAYATKNFTEITSIIQSSRHEVKKYSDNSYK